MPYIKEKDRKKFDPLVNTLIDKLFVTGWKMGFINYIISKILWDYFNRGPSYNKVNEIVGVLECIKAEFLRRQAGPYEDEKIKENGDL